MWECGLKHHFDFWLSHCGSHSLCGSVDWNVKKLIISGLKAVTPYVGVWIETASSSLNVVHSGVTPYVGVWIETWHQKTANNPWCVTPYVGVWIETFTTVQALLWPLSLLMWECGLKQKYLGYYEDWHESLLMWECGLKLILWSSLANLVSHSLCGSVDWNLSGKAVLLMNPVTPYVGEWIET